MNPSGGETSSFSDTEEPVGDQQLNQNILLHTLHDTVKSKSRERRCPSLACNTLLTVHQFGAPSRLCSGPPQESSENHNLAATSAETGKQKPTSTRSKKAGKLSNPGADVDAQLQHLQAELDTLSHK